MTTTTLTHSELGYARRGGRGFFRRLLDNMIATREAEARRHVARALRGFSDKELFELGFTREELAQWHAGRNG